MCELMEIAENLSAGIVGLFHEDVPQKDTFSSTHRRLNR